MITQQATPGEVEEWASQAQDGWVECRATAHHSWEPETASHNGARHYFDVTERCRYCEATRSYVLDEYGDYLSHPSTKYPDGYLLPKGAGRVGSDTRGRLRVARLERRFVVKDMSPKVAATSLPESLAAQRALGVANSNVVPIKGTAA